MASGMLLMPQPHTHAHMESINRTQKVIINNEKEDVKLKGRQGGGSQDNWRELMVGGYNQNTLCKCVKFSKNKFQKVI